MIKIESILLCLCIIICFSITSLAQDSKIDSLNTALANTTDDSARFGILIDLHNAHFKSHPEESRRYALEMIKMGEQAGNLFRTYKGYLALNRYETKYRNYDKIIPNSKMLLSIAKKLGNKDEIFDRTLGLAHNYIDAEHNDLVIRQLEQAMKVAKENRNDVQINKVNYALGFYYHQIGASDKAIPFLEKAIRKFRESGDDKSLADAIEMYAETSLSVNPEPKTLNLLITAEKLHEKTNSLFKRAYIRSLIGKYFSMNGNTASAVENYSHARSMYKKDNNIVDYALVGLDLSRDLLAQNRLQEAKSVIRESQDIINGNKYAAGKPYVELAWAEYYIRTNGWEAAKSHLKQLSALVSPDKSLDLQLGHKQLQAALSQQSANEQHAGETLFDYYKMLFKYKQKPSIIAELNSFERRYPVADSSVGIIKAILSSDTGYRQLKAYFTANNYNGIIIPDSFFVLPESDSSTTKNLLNDLLGLDYDAQLDAVDAVLNKKLLQDRLSEEKQNYRRNIIWSSAMAIMLLAVITILIVYSRRLKKKKEQSERDKKAIENLHYQLNHLMVNNLKSVSNYIDLAMKESDKEDAIQSLKVRVEIASQFYSSYKKQKITAQLDSGQKVHLQKHVEDVATYLKVINSYDNDFLQIDIDAGIAVSYNVGLHLILVASELIQNSCKYAFDDSDDESENRISISISFADTGTVRMSYIDTGKGKPADATGNLGSEIIREIAETLQADINEFNDNGYHFVLEMKLKKDEYKKAEPQDTTG